MTKGRIVQVMGPVVDVEFNSREELPFIKDALEVDNGGKRCVMEVAQHVGNNIARCIMLSSSEGLQKGMEVTVRRFLSVPYPGMEEAVRVIIMEAFCTVIC